MKTTFPDSNFAEIRDKLYALRHNYFDNMDKYILDLERVLTGKNIEVLWSKDSNSLLNSIQEKINDNSFNRVCVDSNFNITNKMSDCDVISPSELENSLDDVDLLVIDSDFAVCDSGSLVFIDKKSQNCFNKVKNLFVIVNIDQIIPSIADLSLFLSFFNKNNNLPDNIRIIQSKPQYITPSTEIYTSDTPNKQDISITVLFNLNDIENILSVEELVPSLYCINCGRCFDVCPVAKATENNPLSPIEIVKKNAIDSYNRSQHIFKNTTFCGACDDVCPVKVPLTNLMLYEMQASNLSVNLSRPKQLYSLFKKRANINKVNNSVLKFFFIRRFFGRNKMLCRYFSDNTTDFFNLTFTPPHEDNPNEIFKDSDFE